MFLVCGEDIDYFLYFYIRKESINLKLSEI